MDPYIYTEKPKYQPHDIEEASEFYDIIERSSLTHQLSKTRPYIYWTMEIYDKANGIKGGGGLGSAGGGHTTSSRKIVEDAIRSSDAILPQRITPKKYQPRAGRIFRNRLSKRQWI
ncbi:hypothetical protein KOY48_04505 [Candidatus Minimicrobia naudis]|uniref:Uncharacterized protein n=1 Tax=Candidatus Minimicrobia naudis TaxID=2841263 RepID=A0A8F1SB00_9BACT|nr:hypothetical protein KOY48_04505 [Candidatus Minimicrobia naudis]